MKLLPQSSTVRALRAENAELRARLEEAGEMLRAIRAGEVDALVVEGDAGPRLYTLQGLDAEQNRIRGEMLSQVNDAVVAVDLDQRLLFLNAAAERQYGVRSSDVLGRPLEEVYTRRWPSTEAEAGKQVALRERGEWRGELIHRTVDGREFPVEVCVTLLRGADGECTGAVAAIRDVTLRKAMEQEKAEASRLLDTLLTRAPVGFVFLDRDLRFVRINERLAEMNGLPVAAHLGRTVEEILPSLASNLHAVAARIIATGRPVIDHEFTGETARSPGITRYWNESWYPVHDERGEIIGFGAVVEDITERKGVDAALRLSNKRFDLAVTCSRAVLWQQDLELRFTWLHNPAPGIDGSDAVGKRDADLLERAEDAAVIEGFKREVIRSGVGLRREFFPQIQGVGHCFDVLIEPLRDAAGLITGITGAAIDITELKRAEQARHEIERNYQALAVASYEVAYRMSADWSEMLPLDGRDLLSTSEEPLGDWAWMDRNLPRDEHPRVRRAISEAIAWKTLFELEHRVRRADGSDGWTLSRAVPILDASGEVVTWFGAAADITDRKQAEQALADRTELLDRVLEGTSDVIFVSDLNGRCLVANAACAAMLDCAREQVVGKTMEELCPPDRAAAARQHDEAVIASDRPIQREESFVVAGEARVFLTLKAPLRDGSSHVVGILGISRDITERKRAEEALRDNAVMLTDLDRRKDAFLATLSHELRNPLGVIASSLHLLRLGGQDPDAVQQGCARMQRQVVLLTRLIDDLMDVSRINQDKLTLRTARLDLATVARSAVENSRTVLDLRGHTVNVVFPPQPIEVDGDAERLGQIVSNLLTNAAKYSDPGTPITLTVERQGHVAAVAVRDRGIGIAPGDLGRVFELFAQVRSAAHLAQGGVGIGLNLVKRVVELHGGTVEARSGGLGRGSEFLVRLPLASARARPERPPDDEVLAPSPPRRYRILVADDNEDAVTILALLLSQLGHEVRIANDGAQAVAVAALFKPEVALLDIGMPELDGYEACRRIRAQPGGDAMVLIALSGWGRVEDKRRARNAGFQHHLVKPLDPADLTALLHSLAPALSDPVVDGRRWSMPMSIAGPG